MPESLDLPIVIPCYNEALSLDRLASELRPVLRDLRSGGTSVEVIFLDDGSRDGTWAALQTLAASLAPVAPVRLQRHTINLGQPLRVVAGDGSLSGARGGPRG